MYSALPSGWAEVGRRRSDSAATVEGPRDEPLNNTAANSGAAMNTAINAAMLQNSQHRGNHQLSSAAYAFDSAAIRQHSLPGAPAAGRPAAGGGAATVSPPRTRVVSPARRGGSPPMRAVDALLSATQPNSSSSNINNSSQQGFTASGSASAPIGFGYSLGHSGGVRAGAGIGIGGAPDASAAVSTSAFNALQHAHTELAAHAAALERTVASLTRENNVLQGRVASLLDCGLSPDLASAEAYRNSGAAVARGMGLLTESNQQQQSLTSAHHEYGGSGDPSSQFAYHHHVGGITACVEEEFGEVRFLKARVRRLEAALQLEMRSREQLDLKCTAQQAALAQLIARHEEERQLQQRQFYGGGGAGGRR